MSANEETQTRRADEADATAALWSAPGVGALAVVRLSGGGATGALRRRFAAASPKACGQAAAESAEKLSNRVFFGRWRLLDDGGAEEVVLRQAGLDAWEVVCHGGERVAAALLASLRADGVSVVPPEEVRSAPELRGRDALQRAAFADLPHARTERAALGLLAQYQGALSRELERIEADLAAGAAPEAEARLHALLLRARGGRAWLAPLRVVLAGAPNVGKSSLLNALLGYERAITSPTPGTTRDVVSDGAAFDGWPVELRDTAGLRATADPLEAAGVEASRLQIGEADLVLWVRDASRPNLPAPPEFASAAGSHTRRMIVWNKVDRAAPPPAEPGDAAVSATTGAGVEALAPQIAAALFREAERFEPAAGAPWRSEHVSSLQAALALLQQDETAAAGNTLRALRLGDVA